MLNFKTFLLEYLNPDQRENYSHLQMTDKARADTDHFFGAGNDKIHGEIEHDDKSEIHNRLEQHLGRQLSHDEYNTGIVKDKYNRDVKLGKLIKDHDLRNQFDHDVARKTGYKPTIKTTTVRGVEVAGQTNPEPNAEHPKGHSWPGSCKNITDGINKHYLPREIVHGTVVHFVHDHNGQEIYRATLHPHYNNEGHVAYGLDSEYGIKHPKFTESAQKVAEKLSGEYKSSDPVYTKHKAVYNNNGIREIFHPKMDFHGIDTHVRNEISKPYYDQDRIKLRMMVSHPKVSADTLTHVLNNHRGAYVSSITDAQELAAVHPNLTGEHLENALNHTRKKIRKSAILNPNVTAEHLHKFLDDPNNSWTLKDTAFESHAINSSHIDKAIHSGDPDLISSAVRHPKASSKQLDKAMELTPQDSYNVHQSIMSNPNVSPANLEKWSEHPSMTVKELVAEHPKTPDHVLKNIIDKHINDPHHIYTVKNALHNPNLQSHQLEPYLHHGDDEIRRFVAHSPNVTSDQLHRMIDKENNLLNIREMFNERNKNIDNSHIEKILDGDYSSGIKAHAAGHPNINAFGIRKAIATGDTNVAYNALKSPNVTHEHIDQAVRSGNRDIEHEAMWHPLSNKYHWDYIAKHSKSPGNQAVAERFLENGRRG